MKPSLASRTLYRIRWSVHLVITFVVLASFVLCFQHRVAAAETSLRFSRTEPHLGTRVTIIVDVSTKAQAARILKAGFERIEQLDAILSDYRSDSEVNRLCQSAPHQEFVPISRELFEVLDTARALSQQSAGAFDVTIGPVSRLWRRARRRKEMPEKELLAEARRAVGYEKIELRKCPPGVRLSSGEIRVDLGGIAKGYIVDEVLSKLREQGALGALVNAGGDIGVSKPHDKDNPWRVGVASIDPRKKVDRLVTLSKQAIATSGDAFQSVVIDGKRYSHIVDPRTGLGVTGQSSVTVIAPRADLADAWASALSVLGHEKGLAAFPKATGYHAQILYSKTDGTIHVARSDKFPAGQPVASEPNSELKEESPD